MVRHWTPKPVIISRIRSSPTGGNFFFAVVKSFEYKIAISANFVQTVKNSNNSRKSIRPMVYLYLRLAELWQLELCGPLGFYSSFSTLNGTYNEFIEFSEFYKNNDV